MSLVGIMSLSQAGNISLILRLGHQGNRQWKVNNMPMPELTIRAGTLVLAVGTKVPLTYLKADG